MKKILTTLFMVFFSLSAEAADSLSNFATSRLASGVTSSSTSITLRSGEGQRFRASGYNVVVWDLYYGNSADAYQAGRAEIMRVTARSGDVMTVSRAQEGTLAISFNTAGRTYVVSQGVTAKLFSDIAGQITAAQVDTMSLSLRIDSKQPLISNISDTSKYLEGHDTLSISARVDSVSVPLMVVADNTLSISSGSTVYTTFGLGGASVITSMTTARARLYLPPGTMKRLRAMAVATGGAGTCTITVYKTGNPTALSTGSFSTANADWNAPIVDSTHEITFASGDYVQIAISPVTRAVVAFSIYADYVMVKH